MAGKKNTTNVKHDPQNVKVQNSPSGTDMHSCVGKDFSKPSSDNFKFNRSALSFYISNFPRDIMAKDIWQRCSDWGKVVDVYVANRLSKRGNRFGFVRFAKTDNVKLLLKNLRSIWFGKYHLFVDEAKNEKNNVTNKKPVHDLKEKGITVKVPVSSSDNKKTYAQAVSNAGINVSRKRVVIDVEQYDNQCVLLGKLRDPHTIPSIHELCFKEGFEGMNISYVGGRWVKLIFSSVVSKELFIGSVAEKKWFQAVQSASRCFVPDERMSWVELVGLPMGAWNRKAISKIISAWGKPVFFGDDVEESLALGKVCVLLPKSDPIKERVEVELDGVVFDVWANEFSTWSPDISPPQLYSEGDSEEEASTDSDVDGYAESEASVVGFSNEFSKEENTVASKNGDDTLEQLHACCDEPSQKAGDPMENLVDTENSSSVHQVEETPIHNETVMDGGKLGDTVEDTTLTPSKPPGFSKQKYASSSGVSVNNNGHGTKNAELSKGSMDSNVRVNRRVASWVKEINNDMEMGKLMGFQLKGTWEEIVRSISLLREKGGYQ